MAWYVSKADFEYSQNKALVVLADSGGSGAYPRAVTVNFSMGAPGGSPPEVVDEKTLVAQAKQILSDAANSQDAKAR